MLNRIVTRVKKTAPARIEAIGHEPLLIKPEQEPVMVRRRRESYSSWASVDGKLDVISVRRQPYFVIFEHGTDYRVRCIFPDDWLDTVKSYLGHRVIAEGFIHYNQDSSPASLSQPISIELIPEPKQDITAYKGSMPGITGGLSSYEYVRQLREGNKL